MMHSDSLMKKTKEMMGVVLYDPHRFLRAIKRCEDNEYSKWFTEAIAEDGCERIRQQAHSVLASSQLNKEDCEFALLIEDAVEKIQAEEKDSFFLSVQKQIEYHKKVLSDVCFNPMGFVRKLKKCGLENHLRDDYNDVIDASSKKDDHLFRVVEGLCKKGIVKGPARNIENIEQGLTDHLEIKPSMFFALIEQANYELASGVDHLIRVC